MKEEYTTLYSIGHSNRSIETFIRKLKENEIRYLIDIRTTPRSRFSPQFNEDALRNALSENEIAYLYRGKNLGGRGENVDYYKTLGEVERMVRGGEGNICVVCSEGKYQDCHRHTMIEPSLKEFGIDMKHIEYTKEDK